ncbi:hypothetical protein D3C85_1385960 [compost metagenome]
MQAERVGQQAGNERPWSEADDVVGQNQGSHGGRMYGCPADIANYGPRGTGETCTDQHAKTDQDQLGGALGEIEGQQENHCREQRVDHRDPQLVTRVPFGELVDQYASESHANACQEDQHAGH